MKRKKKNSGKSGLVRAGRYAVVSIEEEAQGFGGATLEHIKKHYQHHLIPIFKN